jgi:uncharacterized peroxidase-related enzyme
LDALETKYGRAPNIARVIANSPTAFEAYVAFSGALQQAFTPRLREQIALAVAETNGYGYCLSAHSAAGRFVGLSEHELAEAREGFSHDAREDAALRFAKKLAELRGRVPDEEVERLRSAGFSDAEIVEIVALVALNVFTNYVGLSTRPDFPVVEPRLGEAA